MMEKHRNVVARHEEIIDELKDDVGKCSVFSPYKPVAYQIRTD
jgi:hypothetical protein